MSKKRARMHAQITSRACHWVAQQSGDAHHSNCDMPWPGAPHTARRQPLHHRPPHRLPPPRLHPAYCPDQRPADALSGQDGRCATEPGCSQTSGSGRVRHRRHPRRLRAPSPCAPCQQQASPRDRPSRASALRVMQACRASGSARSAAASPGRACMAGSQRMRAAQQA